jgi:glutathione S-transferase
MAAHVVLEESGEKYEPIRLDLAKGEQRSAAYLKPNPLDRVPVLRLDDGTPLAENTAILPYLGKRFGLWPSDALGEAKLLSLIGYFVAAVHPAYAHVGPRERHSDDSSDFPVRDKGLKTFHGYLEDIDARLAGREWFSDRYSAADPYDLRLLRVGRASRTPRREIEELYRVQGSDAAAPCRAAGA